MTLRAVLPTLIILVLLPGCESKLQNNSKAIVLTDNFEKLDNKNSFLTRGILFDLNNNMRETSFPLLKEVYDVMQAYEIADLEISVHFDERYPADLGVDQSFLRAKKIKDYLVSLGLDKDRLRAVGESSQKPLIKGATNDLDHEKNRRVEFLFKESH